MTEAALGALLGFGLWLLVDGAPRSSLAARIAPHLRDLSRAARRTSTARDLVDVIAAFVPHPARFLSGLWKNRASVRRRLIDAEMPAFLDRASVCLSAGLSIPSMFDRVGADSVGILGREARTIARELGVGVTLVDTCTASENRVRHESWSRLIEHVLSARRHGTPIADIVRSLAADERAAAGRRLLEAASSREIYMLIPLVFVILPMTVLVAVFPGLVALGSLPV
jgi:tight adherence protein C